MKTELQIVNSIEKVKGGLEATFIQAMNQCELGQYDECSETLFTLIANVCALEAATRIIKN